MAALKRHIESWSRGFRDVKVESERRVVHAFMEGDEVDKLDFNTLLCLLNFFQSADILVLFF
jgi:hypothetical protein